MYLKKMNLVWSIWNDHWLCYTINTWYSCKVHWSVKLNIRNYRYFTIYASLTNRLHFKKRIVCSIFICILIYTACIFLLFWVVLFYYWHHFKQTHSSHGVTLWLMLTTESCYSRYRLYRDIGKNIDTMALKVALCTPIFTSCVNIEISWNF